MWPFNFISSLFDKDKGVIPKFPGWITSPFDSRDLPLGVIQELVPIPSEYSTPYKLKVTNQKTTPYCVGHAGALLKAEKERREQNFIDFDPDWLYAECKKIDGMPDVEGTYFRAALKVLKDKGAKLLNGSEADADKYRIGGYAAIQPLTFDNIKSGIYQNGVVLSGFRGSNEGWSRSLKGYIRPPESGEQQWGHAVGEIAYTAPYITGQNSWGENWGDNGKFYHNENYMPIESWVVLVDLPNNWKELIGINNKPRYSFSKNLYFSLTDPDVKALQDCLKYEGCFPREIESIQIFGPLTLEAVKRFQQKYQISPAVGYVGPITRAKLNELFI